MQSYGDVIPTELMEDKKITSLAINHSKFNTGFVTKNGDFYITGSNTHLQCGVGTINTPLTTHTQVMFPEKTQIREAFLIGSSVYAISRTGDLWSCGYGKNGQLGHNLYKTGLMQKVTFPDGELIERLIYPENFTDADQRLTIGAKTCSGKFFLWGYNKQNQVTSKHNKPVPTPTEVTIKHTESKISNVWVIGTGYSAIFATTEDGCAHSKGYNAQGQLGLGHKKNRSEFTTIELFATGNKYIKQVFGGNSNSSLAQLLTGSLMIGTTGFLTTTNEIFMTGYNAHGQCCVESAACVLYPTQIPTANIEVKHICELGGGYSSFFAILENFHYIKWGFNATGQLGCNTTKNVCQPIYDSKTKIKGFFVIPSINAIGCGGIFIIDNTDTLLALGSNNSGEFGVGHSQHIFQLSPARFPRADLIVDIQACGYGAHHTTMILTKNGQAYVAGDNMMCQTGLGVDASPRFTFKKLII